MDNTSKQSAYNGSSYSSRMAQKQAAYNNSKYANIKAITDKSSTPTVTRYTTADGRVLLRNQSNRIDFKSLFASLEDDADLSSMVSRFKSASDNLSSSYAKRNTIY